MSTEDILAHVDKTIDARLARLFDLIRIPSISTDANYAEDCKKAAEWLAANLRSFGADASPRETIGHPMVVGHVPGDGPHVLFYGHYDVQPVDPLDLWETDPFEPVLKPAPNGDTHIVARGASDDKGALMTFVEACRAWTEVRGKLPISVSFLFEGEEESGSRSLVPFLDKTAKELSCDTVLVCDTDMWDPKTPAVTTMVRGFVAQEITLTAADRDLHSGMFGNAARNAVTLLTDILSSLRTPDGGVAVEGFYDGVAELPDEVKQIWSRLPFDGDAFLNNIGLKVPAGEADRSVLEQIWARPACDINGIWGGYTEPGFKAAIPAKAHAKLSFRLVAGQDPQKVRDAFRAHVLARLPEDCTAEFADHGLAPAVSMPTDSKWLKATLAGIADEWGDAAIAGTGGSIPIIAALQKYLGADALLVGFANFDNRIHSPNEKYDLSSYHKGIRSWVRILEKLASA